MLQQENRSQLPCYDRDMDAEIFYRNLEDKQAKLVAKLEVYFDTAISDKDRTSKNQTLAALAAVASTIVDQLSPNDTPQWLTDIVTAAKSVAGHPDKHNVFKSQFDRIKSRETAIRRHKWVNSGGGAQPILDFDEIVEKHRNKEVVNKLFDTLIDSLSKLIQCDELDSRRVIEDLEGILATVRNSKKASFYSQVLSVRVAARYMKNFGKAWVLQSKAGKAAAKAAEDTADELGLTMEEAKEKIQEELSSVGDSLNQRLSQSVPKQLSIKPNKNDKEEHPDK